MSGGNVWRGPHVVGITGQRPQGMLTHGVPITLTSHTVKDTKCISAFDLEAWSGCLEA